MGNKRVLFIIHDVYQDDNQFPLGAGYLAAAVKGNGGKPEAYCMDVFHHSHDDLALHLDKNDYDLICVGFLAARFKETVQSLCETINLHKKGAWLVLGGQGPSPIPEYMIETTGADIVAIGEAEQTIVELLECKAKGEGLREIKGIAFREGSKAIVNERREPVKDLDSISSPLWEIFPMDKYTSCFFVYNQEPHERSLGIITSRGCVNRCNFCYRMEKGIRLRSIGNIVEEMKELYVRYGVTNYIFHDELFVLNKRRLREFEIMVRSAGLQLKFSCTARVDIFDEEMIRILKKAGCQFVNIGFESSSDNVLRLMNKNTTVEMNLKALQTIHEVGGIGAGLNFIWNNLGDNKQTLWDNVKLIKRYNTYDQIRTIRPVTPYPGSDLYYTLIEKGKLKGPQDFFERFTNSDLMIVNLTGMSDKEAYAELLAANTELILDHFRHTGGDMSEAERLIRNFSDLYSGKEVKFRGARHYEKKESRAER